ncbi:hypothetical protein PENTCL1PPCAC_7266, partial [Pristionchus entomophagus]
ERSIFFISFLVFITQALNIVILLSYFYFLLISLNVSVVKVIASVMIFPSDLFSLGPGIYTFILPGPIRKKCMEILMTWRKKSSKDSS